MKQNLVTFLLVASYFFGYHFKVADSSVTSSTGSTLSGYTFTSNPGGGSGDQAYIKYYNWSGEACVLEIGTSDDADDHIFLNPSGNVGIGKREPSAKLDVIGDFCTNCSIKTTISIGFTFFFVMQNEQMPQSSVTISSK